MKDLYVKRSTVLTAVREWWEQPYDTRNLFEVLQNVSDDIILAKPWNRTTDKLPVVDGNYMVTVLNDGVVSTHEAVFKCGRFYDPVEEWERFTNVIAWSGMPEPYKPEV